MDKKKLSVMMKNLKEMQQHVSDALEEAGESPDFEAQEDESEEQEDYKTTPEMGDGSVNEEPEDDSGDGDISMAKEAKKKMLVQMMKKKMG